MTSLAYISVLQLFQHYNITSDIWTDQTNMRLFHVKKTLKAGDHRKMGNMAIYYTFRTFMCKRNFRKIYINKLKMQIYQFFSNKVANQIVLSYLSLQSYNSRRRLKTLINHRHSWYIYSI